MKKFSQLILAICIFLVCACFIGYVVGCITYSRTVEYNLCELEDGVYGYYNTVSSNTPAHNYETIILCVNGNILTFNGDVNICYTTGTPKIVWRQTKIVYGDNITVYVPHGSIDFRGNVGLH